jgi:hypothetical protein
MAGTSVVLIITMRRWSYRPSCLALTERTLSVAWWQDVVPIAIVVALFVVGFILLLIPQTRSNLFELLTWADSGPLAVSVYSVVFIVSVLIGLPSVVFVVAAGFTFKWYAVRFAA